MGALKRNIYIKVFKKYGYYALFNGTNMKLLYVNPRAYEIFKSNSLRYASDKRREEIKSIFRKYLFLVDQNIDEFSLLKEYCRKKEVLNRSFKGLRLFLTKNCNLRCKYCLGETSNKGRHKCVSMELNIAKSALVKFFDSIDSKVIPYVVLYGGEPLLVPELVCQIVKVVEEIKQAKGQQASIFLFTNGTLVSKEIAEFLANNDVGVIVSIDGPEEIHNKMRLTKSGEGSFFESSQGYLMLKNSGCKVGISTVVGPHNIDRVKEIVTYFCEEFGPASIGLNMPHYTKAVDESIADEVPPRKYATALVEAFLVAREYGIFVDQALRRILCLVKEFPRIRDCSAYGEEITISPKGERFPCYSLVAFDRSKTSIFKSNCEWNKWKERNTLTLLACRECPMIAACGGGCAYDALICHGDIEKIDKRYCIVTEYLMDWFIWEVFENVYGRYIKDSCREPKILEPSFYDKVRILGSIEKNKSVLHYCIGHDVTLISE